MTAKRDDLNLDFVLGVLEFCFTYVGLADCYTLSLARFNICIRYISPYKDGWEKDIWVLKRSIGDLTSKALWYGPIP